MSDTEGWKMSVFKTLIFILFITIAVSGSLYALSYEELLPYLKDIDGWNSKKGMGVNIDGKHNDFIMAERIYTRPDALITAKVISGMQAQMQWATYSSQKDYETEDKLLLLKEIQGFSTIVVFNKENREGSILILLNPDSQPSAILNFSFQGISYKEALEFAQKFDLQGLSAVIKG